MRELAPERRRRLIFRALPVVGVVAVLALVAGMMVGSRAPSASEQTAVDFAAAWERSDIPAMYALLDERSRASHSLRAFRRAYARSAATATVIRVAAGPPDGERDGAVEVPVNVYTRVFGVIRRPLLVPVQDDRVAWDASLTFPGLPAGARMSRRSLPPERATLLARDGEVLAEGSAEARSSPLGGLAASVAGVLGPATRPVDRAGLYARGFPRDWPVGQNGLERAFEGRLAGVPGGVLVADDRVLASAEPRKARAVRTTIDTDLQEAAVAALAGRLGGIAALDPRTGEIRALAGLAFSAPQPPGSTFKIVTATAALEARAVRPRTTFPILSAATIDGVELENANGEFCGGSFRDSFAHSCNSVFAPLGVKLGAQRLVDAALRYGWNAPPTVIGEAPSTIPPAEEITSPLEVGSTAIGQGRVLATPLRLASVAQTVGSGGVRARAAARGRAGADAGPGHLATGGADAREPDGRCGGLRNRHRGGHRGNEGGREDRDRGARGHARAERRGGASGRRIQHRRLVHRLRARAPPADRGGRDAGASGRRRGDGRAGGPVGARAGARQVSGSGERGLRCRGRR